MRIDFRRSRAGEDGFALPIALVIVTVVALVVGALVSQAYTNSGATIGLRAQAASEAAAEAAAEYATNEVRLKGQALAVGDLCGGTGSTASTRNYPAIIPSVASAPAMTATVVCRPSNVNIQGGNPTAANTSPGNALLTLNDNVNQNGIYAQVNAGSVRVRGSVFSNSKVAANSGLINTWTPQPGSPIRTYNYVRAASLAAAQRCPGLSLQGGAAVGVQDCAYSQPDIRGVDPGTLTPHGASYDPPPGTATSATISACTAPNNKYQTVTPGKFEGAAALTALNGLSGCNNKLVWFEPGTYYFNLPGLWNVGSYYVVAGTLKAANINPDQNPNSWAQDAEGNPTIQDACVGPGESGATGSTGALFVFGGQTRLGVNTSGNPNSQMTVCGSNSSSGPPIAFYGLKTSVGSVPALSTCTPAGSGSTGCAVLSSGNSPRSLLVIKGTTYAPRGVVGITLNNRSVKRFQWGLIAWGVEFMGTGSADVASALIDVPDSAENPFPAANAFVIKVYTCKANGNDSCSTGGTPNLQTAVRIKSINPGTVDVLSWSHNR